MVTREQRVPDEKRRLLMTSCAQQYYLSNPPLSQARIARNLGIHASYVSRLLKEARMQEIVHVQILEPPNQKLPLDLIRKFSLRGVHIVTLPLNLRRNDAGPSAADLSELLGQAGARYLEEPHSPLRNGARVGVACGSTLLEMTVAFTKGRFKNLKVCPLTIEGLPEFMHEASSTLVGLFRFKFPEQCKTYAPLIMPHFTMSEGGKGRGTQRRIESIEKEMRDLYGEAIERVERYARDLDVAIVGIGHLDIKAKDRSFSQILREAEITEALLRKHGVVGEIANCPYDKHGEDQSKALGLSRKTVLTIPLDTLKNLARTKPVVAIAGGKEKLQAIYTALNAQMVNILVTDSCTAEALLKLRES